MSLFTVEISNVTPDTEVYGGLVAALSYAGKKFGTVGSDWIALTTDQQGQSLFEATNFLDQQAWDGLATGTGGTTLQFPRSGLTRDGVVVDSTTVPPEIVQATFELAFLISADPDLLSAVDTGTNVSSVSAGGGVGVTFFSPTSAFFGTASRLPIIIARLVARFLAVPSADAGGAGQPGSSCSAMTAAQLFVLNGAG